MILDKLRANTKQNHEDLEAEMLPMIKGIRTKADYARLLRIFYGFYKPLEEGIDQYIGEHELPDLQQRRKTSLILDDLVQLGQPFSDIPIDASAPSINSIGDAFGAMYVMEGSTLGGKVISKMIASGLGINEQQGLSFFHGYGGETGSRWKTFLARLDVYSDTPEESAVVKTANDVFNRFQHWIKEKK